MREQSFVPPWFKQEDEGKSRDPAVYMDDDAACKVEDAELREPLPDTPVGPRPRGPKQVRGRLNLRFKNKDDEELFERVSKTLRPNGCRKTHARWKNGTSASQ